MNGKAFVTALVLGAATVGAAHAGRVAWNININGGAGGIGFGVGAGSPTPVVMVPPPLVVAAGPVAFGPRPVGRRWGPPPMRVIPCPPMVRAPVLVSAPVRVAPPMVVGRPVFVAAPVFVPGW